MRPQRLSRGFTLVELLVVIAIIGILAGLIAAGLPVAMKKARLANANNNFTQIRTILIAYYTDHGSFPPMYGYISDEFKGDNRRSANDIASGIGVDYTVKDALFLLPWDAMAGIHANLKLRDTFAKTGYDINTDGNITRLEFAPLGNYNSSNDTYTFNFDGLYFGDNGAGATSSVQADLNRQLNTNQTRPYVFASVNERQFRVFKRIVEDDASNSSDPRPYNLSQNAIDQINQRLIFPPASYDKFVLISVGPDGPTGFGDFLPEFGENGFMNVSQIPAVNQYHILGLALYYMATRDAENGGEGDGEPDFDYIARTTRGQADVRENYLPGRYPKAGGPLIYTGGT